MEIERKFLTKEVPFSLADFPVRKISQCYISMSPTIRLRQLDDRYILTVKGKGLLAKEEFELDITKEEYDHLLTKAESPAVEKVRYLVPLEGGLTAEVDVYHIGPNAGLGSRHNVSHWGCGAKEARISQAAWNRFYYYLTTDDRCGDLMTEVKDADQKLYTLDPMRLAQPRSQYPCTAPARLRIGPDWLAYAGNWMTEWERTGNTVYRDKIIAGMKSIVALPNRIFTGPLALGYDPATGIITSECDPKLESTNHLMTIMGGFEVMNEMIRMVDYPEWNEAWLDLAARYKQKAWELRKNRFRISRLLGYAAYHTRNAKMAEEAWTDLFSRLEHTPAPPFRIETVLPPEVPAPLDECTSISTNDAALWSLDAIYMQEVIPVDDMR